MSNNVLYLVNDDDQSVFPLAKSMANGWYYSPSMSDEDLLNRLQSFLMEDVGGYKTHGKSKIRVMTDEEEVPNDYHWYNYNPPKLIHFQREPNALQHRSGDRETGQHPKQAGEEVPRSS